MPAPLFAFGLSAYLEPVRMTCWITIRTGRPSGQRVSPSSRPSGSSCARRASRTPKRSRRSPTTAASRRTPRASRIPIRSRTRRTSSRTANARRREIAFLITLRERRVIGGCGIATLDGETPEIGYWLGVPFWGQGFATEAARAADRPCLRRSRLRGAARRRAREQPGLAPRAGEVRLPVDRRRAATASARSTRRRRSTASASTAACGPRSRAGHARRGGVIAPRRHPHRAARAAPHAQRRRRALFAVHQLGGDPLA